MTYRNYIRGDDVTLGVAPTGYRYSTDTNEALPVTPETVATQVSESVSLGASVAHLHGRDDSGDPAPERLPLFGAAVRDACDEDILLEYAVGPDCPLGDFVAVLDTDPTPDLASVRVGPIQYDYRETSTTSRRDVDQLVAELTDREITPNFLVTGGRDLHELQRLQEQSALPDPFVVTVLFGAPNGTVGTPLNVVSLLDSVPDDAHCFVRATGPNQYPLTALAFFLGAHPMVGMEDNLFFAPDQPVGRNAQLVGQTTELARNSLRDIAPIELTRAHLTAVGVSTERDDVEA